MEGKVEGACEAKVEGDRPLVAEDVYDNTLLGDRIEGPFRSPAQLRLESLGVCGRCVWQGWIRRGGGRSKVARPQRKVLSISMSISGVNEMEGAMCTR